MNFKKTTVATFVGAALATMAFGAVANSTFNKSQHFNGSNSSQSIKAIASKNSANSTVTASGMRNEFDRSSGKATFKWAGLNEAKPDLGAIASEYQLAYAADFYLNKLQGVSANKNSNIKPILSMVHDVGRGAKLAKYKQEISGIEVFNREFNIMMDPEYNLVASSGYFADQKTANSVVSQLKLKDTSSAFGDATKAISIAFVEMGGDDTTIALAPKGGKGKYEQFTITESGSYFKLVGQPRAKKVYFEIKGNLTPAYYVELEASTADSVNSSLYSFVIDAKSGKVLFKNDLTSHAEKFNYRVYADETGKPWDSPHGNVIPAPADADPKAYIHAPYVAAPMVSITNSPFSKNDPWLADDATETVGNNASAYIDAIAPDGLTNGDYTADITSANTFDYAYNDSEGEYSVNNRKAAIVNLFLMVNYLHDDFYDHGFDEESGNAQADNYGRGGYEGDPLRAEAQDNSGFNNANMSTPADGYSPRMQMFLWDKNDAANGVDWGITVTSDANIGLLQSTRTSALGPNVFAEFSGKLVRIEDGTAPVNDGCEAAVNGADLAGNIAVIDRGACAFSQKILNAQAEGAIAVIVANNREADPVTMGGDGTGITIPNMMISQEEGAILYSAMAANDVVVSMFSNETERNFKGSSWDNGIVAHEWGHYISNRLVGNSNGLINNQGRSMGEGWGDFHALLALSDADDAMMAGNEMFGTAYSATSYVASFTDGIRRVPYSTNMEVNPLTFKDIEISAEVHDSGEIWASMLWDSFVALINDDRHTFDEARSLMKDYLVAGYKMTPIAPTFSEARDAILAAAYANDPEDYKLILAAFARRGLGLNAESPSRFSTDHLGVVESYETKLSTFNVSSHAIDTNFEGLTTGYCTNDNVLDKGETGTVSFKISNNGSEALSGVVGQVEVVSGQDVTFANDGVITFGDVGLFSSSESSPIEFVLNEAATADTLEFKVTFPDLDEAIKSSEYSFSTTVNYDFTKRAPVNHSALDDMETVATMHDFSENVMVGGEMAKGTGFLDTRFANFFRDNITDIGDQYLFINNNAFESDVAYETRTFEVGFNGDFVIDWFHYFDFEESWDGGVVEISVNGGEWADVTEMGGQYLGNGYPSVIDDRAGTSIAGKNAFTGFDVAYEAVSFGETLNGNQVKFRFRAVSDSNTNALGWIIDGVNVSNVNTSVFSDVIAGDSVACDNRLPFVSVSGTTEVSEGGAASLSASAIDPNADDVLTYSWKQTAGTPATIENADTDTISITAPQIAVKETMTFEVTVSDGTGSVTESASMTVNTVAPVKTAAQKSSGGGSTGFLALLLLPLALLRRRK